MDQTLWHGNLDQLEGDIRVKADDLGSKLDLTDAVLKTLMSGRV
jgi:hypothetical protein